MRAAVPVFLPQAVFLYFVPDRFERIRNEKRGIFLVILLYLIVSKGPENAKNSLFIFLL